MALQKSIETPSGVNASYWKITKITVDSSVFFIESIISGYYDEQARIDGREPLLSKQYSWLSSAENFETEISAESNIIANIYARIKLTDDFQSALDV